MKAIPKINTDGLFIEDDIVDDSFTGVVPFYELPDTAQEDGTGEPLLAGYTVGYPVTAGLYQPRFDLEAWEAHQEAVQHAEQAFQEAIQQWNGEGELPEYRAPQQPELWLEALSEAEIAELKQPGQLVSETDLLKERLSDLEIVLSEMLLKG
ncbi:hypothetical protein [Paenibacillus massiliensis]|uniref:hypothetical protein n=1 Tax=Paenibacillus massiliensis TaxID=225917 RepID=UPI000422B004|nr:hypothetical protein [Paenibacillus massiliensis]